MVQVDGPQDQIVRHTNIGNEAWICCIDMVKTRRVHRMCHLIYELTQRLRKPLLSDAFYNYASYNYLLPDSQLRVDRDMSKLQCAKM